ncbi:sugar phosphate isomerase/epimerase [Microvirga sp. HBU67558]|uniref:sugar phosphate isomerase/epimerase family protein n=1 Tax=Microvirga TaxID=186650 RepID=UPI001B39B190|nr:MULTISPECIES: sugar phosphate isomerase/epimerase family protein [unclassified Microvirga]MBQ0820683.1 sugar phosphate isomerase/epimerase [Microvirga sp. HBU67558]
MGVPEFTTLPLSRCSINTATLGHRSPIGEVIERIARHGFGAISPWRRDLEGHDVNAVARQIRDAGLSLSGYCRGTYFPGATRADFEAHVDDNRRALDDAAALGAPCFVLVVGSLPEGRKDLGDARAQVAEGISLLLEKARSVGVTLAVEPLHPMYAGDRSCVTSLGEALALCEALDPDRLGGIGTAIDVYHVWWDWRLEADIAAAGKAGRISAFHVCDWLVPTTDLLLDRGMTGDGVIDVKGIRRTIEAAGYDGFVEVEVFSRRWWSTPEDEVLQACAKGFAGI